MFSVEKEMSGKERKERGMRYSLHFIKISHSSFFFFAPCHQLHPFLYLYKPSRQTQIFLTKKRKVYFVKSNTQGKLHDGDMETESFAEMSTAGG